VHIAIVNTRLVLQHKMAINKMLIMRINDKIKIMQIISMNDMVKTIKTIVYYYDTIAGAARYYAVGYVFD
jgi:hypothetical protein